TALDLRHHLEAVGGLHHGARDSTKRRLVVNYQHAHGHSSGPKISARFRPEQGACTTPPSVPPSTILGEWPYAWSSPRITTLSGRGSGSSSSRSRGSSWWPSARTATLCWRRSRCITRTSS